MIEKNIRPLRIFLSYAYPDRPAVRDLYERLTKEGFNVWLDEKVLFPGQDWRDEIRKAIFESDLVLVCLSKNTVYREGFFAKEIRDALENYNEKPVGNLSLIPARLEECDVPASLNIVHWVDLFEENGWLSLMRSIEIRKSQVFHNGSFDNESAYSIQKNLNIAETPSKDSLSEGLPMTTAKDKSSNWNILNLFQTSKNVSELFSNVNSILKDILVPGAGDVEKIAASQIKLLTSYYSLVLSQAQRSFAWALIWATVGVLGFIAAGAFLLMNQLRDIALIGAVGSALVEVISGINFYLYNKASVQLAEFHTRLDATQKLLLSNAVAEKIEGELKQITRSHIALKFAGIDVKPEVVEESLDLTPKVHIAHIELNPTGSDVAKEFVTLENSGKVVADMTNWSLSDEAGHTFKFPMFFLKPGASVNIWTRNGKNISTDLYWKMKRAIWNNNEDVAYLRDSNGTMVDTFKYRKENKKIVK